MAAVQKSPGGRVMRSSAWDGEHTSNKAHTLGCHVSAAFGRRARFLLCGLLCWLLGYSQNGERPSLIAMYLKTHLYYLFIYYLYSFEGWLTSLPCFWSCCSFSFCGSCHDESMSIDVGVDKQLRHVHMCLHGCQRLTTQVLLLPWSHPYRDFGLSARLKNNSRLCGLFHYLPWLHAG